jgi:hypothetical protein
VTRAKPKDEGDDSAAEIDASVAQLLKDLRNKKIEPGLELDAHVKVLAVAIKWQAVRARVQWAKWGSALGDADAESEAAELEDD